MEHVILPRQLVNQILHQAQLSPEAEVCGLIAASNGRPRRCIAVPNVASEPGRLFTMDPKSQIDAQREMRERGEELFAIYHSHPHSPAEPSAADLEQAGYPDALYIIISLDTKGVLDMRGFYLRDGEVQAVHLEI